MLWLLYVQFQLVLLRFQLPMIIFLGNFCAWKKAKKEKKNGEKTWIGKCVSCFLTLIDNPIAEKKK